jgi:hypothetical protein
LKKMRFSSVPANYDPIWLAAHLQELQQFSDDVVTPAGPTAAVYSVSNVTTTRTYDAASTDADELADVLGTLIADLQSKGVIR